MGGPYLTRINPIVEPAIDAANVLTFGNAAVQHRFAEASGSYRAVWHAFDNRSGASTRVAETQASTERMPAPPGLPSQPGAWVRVDVSAASPAHASWADPVHAYFRRLETGWKLVGFERQPDGQPAGLP